MNGARSALIVALMSVCAQSSLGQSEFVNQPPREVSLFELRKNPAAYNNCLVRVRGELQNVDIGIWDPKTGHCLVGILLEFEDEFDVAKESRPFRIYDLIALAKSGELQSTLAKLPWIVPFPVKQIPADQLKAVRRFWKRKDNRRIGIEVVGRFDYIGNGGRLIMHRDGTISWTGGFGPQPQWGERIVVESIVIQKKTRRGILR